MDGERPAAAAAWLRGTCAELGIDARVARAVVAQLPAAFASPPDGLAVGVLLARALCGRGDHAAEAAVGRVLVDAAGEDPAGSAGAWLVVVDALLHAALRDPGRGELLVRVRDEALAGVADAGSAARMAGLGTGATRRLIDPIVSVLLDAERALGLPPSPEARDLERRREARAVPRPGSAAFLDRHGEGVAVLAARDGRAWWHERFVERFGGEPPAGWWRDDGAGGWISPQVRDDDWFDDADERAFADEMEARYRDEMGLPARGEGWVSGAHLARCVEVALPGVEVVREARAPWLGRQRLDVYLPALGVAFEYQGEQHYLPLPHWGGEAGLAARRELDERKRDACVRAGVRLVEWRYDEPVSVEAVRRRLEGIRLVRIERAADSMDG